MAEITKIEWDDYPEQKPRKYNGPPKRPEFNAIRALAIGEAIKFPCTWSHTFSPSGVLRCSGKSGAQVATRNDYPERYIEAVCTDKMVYVRRTENRLERK